MGFFDGFINGITEAFDDVGDFISEGVGAFGDFLVGDDDIVPRPEGVAGPLLESGSFEDDDDGLLGGLFDNQFFDFLGRNPSIAFAGITSAASLVSNLFGSSIQEDELAFLQEKFEQELAFNREQLASRERIAAEQAAVAREGIEAQAGAAKRNDALNLARSRATVISDAAQRKVNAVRDRPNLIAIGRQFQAQQASRTAQIGQQGFAQLASQATRGLG